MRHLLITPEFPPDHGGIARYLQALVDHWPTQFSVLRPPRWPRWIPTLWLLRRLHTSLDQLWVSHVLPLGTVAWICRRLWNIPYVVMLHGMDFALAQKTPRKQWLLKRILLGARCVVCNSDALAKEVSATVPSVNPVVVHPPLPVVCESLLQVKREPRGSRPLRLLTVSRLVARKNHRAILEALQEISGVEYHIVGQGPEIEGIQNQIQVLGLHDRVVLHTKANDAELLEAYRSADVFVLPVIPDREDREGFGIVYLEAAAAGLPIIATCIPGVLEALHPDGALLLEEPTPSALVSLLLRLQKDPSLCQQMSEVNQWWAEEYTKRREWERLSSYV